MDGEEEVNDFRFIKSVCTVGFGLGRKEVISVCLNHRLIKL